jgi:uncharacterized protein YecE (DUF72 family)
MLLRVGRPALIGEFARYAERFNLLEVPTEAGRAPRRQRLKSLREQAPESFTFAVVLPTTLSTLEPNEDERGRVLGIADELAAEFLLLRTPASVRPGARSVERLGALIRSFEGRRLVWEPAGLFDEETSDAVAAQVGILVVRDLSRDDPAPGPAVYTRIKSLGHGGRVSTSAADRIADRLEGAEAAYVVLDGRGAFGVAQQLRAMLTEEDEVS